MKDVVEKVIKNIVTKVLNEETLKPGMEFRLPFPGEKGGRMLAKKYGVSPEDFEYIAAGKFVYKPKIKPKKPKAEKPKEYLGRKEGETEQDYLERVRHLNQKFADTESEMEGEEWRPIVNTGRYRGGNTDYTRSHEVSNMGRIRTVDFEDPMRSRISTGYDAPTRKARQFHLDAMTDDGEWEKTTPPVHTMVADAWLDAPEGNIEDYDVEHIDGNYHNNRADNLRYVLRKGRRGRNNKSNNISENMNLQNKLKETIMESVKQALNEGTTDSRDIERWEMAKEMLGADQMLDAFMSYMSSDQISQMLEWLNDDYELWSDDDEEDEEELYENKVREIVDKVHKNIKKKLMESGHLYAKDDEGNVTTNSKETYRGVPNSTFIWHGEWSDPEILWKDKLLNANDVEEGLWYAYRDECRENQEDTTEEGFEAWLKEMGTDYIASTLDDYLYAE